MNAPILLMTYRRPINTEKILKLLQKYNQKNVFIFNDGLKIKDHIKDHAETRKVILKYKKINKYKIIFPKKKFNTKK